MFKRIPQGTFFQQGKINSSRSRDSKYVKKRGCNTRNQSEQRIFSQSPVLSREKGRGQRPVINLKELNSHLGYQHFKMEGIHSVRDIMQKGDWMIKIDLTDAYSTLGYTKFIKNTFNSDGKENVISSIVPPLEFQLYLWCSQKC